MPSEIVHVDNVDFFVDFCRQYNDDYDGDHAMDTLEFIQDLMQDQPDNVLAWVAPLELVITDLQLHAITFEQHHLAEVFLDLIENWKMACSSYNILWDKDT
ncbi:Aste57867_6057 [Aphanomyces stellatus]|uniref:Aste57867_6057 protein n=1 Tax=Aphanomyces stellatus TaxID=120398 RepID=A0A485KF34_9STRA|nr:hypothetical protein As57867_006043 [Aphanomyces stellatus]VFT83070.1 Aste57867_6057 [Aphanomyces stellatus]